MRRYPGSSIDPVGLTLMLLIFIGAVCTLGLAGYLVAQALHVVGRVFAPLR